MIDVWKPDSAIRMTNLLNAAKKVLLLVAVYTIALKGGFVRALQ